MLDGGSHPYRDSFEDEKSPRHVRQSIYRYSIRLSRMQQWCGVNANSAVLDGSAHCCHLANTIELHLMSSYFDHLLDR